MKDNNKTAKHADNYDTKFREKNNADFAKISPKNGEYYREKIKSFLNDVNLGSLIAVFILVIILNLMAWLLKGTAVILRFLLVPLLIWLIFKYITKRGK